MTTVNPNARAAVGEYKWGFHDDEKPLFIADKGLNAEMITAMSTMKGEPAWMLENRLDALETFRGLKNPPWAGSPGLLDAIDFENIHYYVRATDRDATNWDDVPDYIKNTFDKLGIPQAERDFLAGAGAQYDS
jgi:Fe-S cluster assembly protein SufB